MEATVINAGNRFSLKRFASYASLYVTANRRKLLLGALQVFIFTFLFTIFILYMGNGIYRYENYREEGGTPGIDPFWTEEAMVMMILVFVFMAFAGSWMFSSMIGKRDRLDTIEVPALQSEKFLTWWCLYLPVALLVILASFWLSDLLRVIWVKAFTPFGDDAHLIPLEYIVNFREPDWYNSSAENHSATFIIYSVIVCCNAVFALGSIFFHKLNFLKTVITGFILMAVVSLVFSLGRNIFFAWNEVNLTERFDIDMPENGYVIGGIIFLIAACIHTFAYYRYREEEIINRW